MTLTYVVAYARFSSDNQREESIDAQLRAIRQYCQQHDYILLDTYIDEARSATTDDRPAFQQMIKDSASGDWSAVIVHKLDRFSRNRYDSAIYKKQLKDNGVHIESVLERLDDSPESVILESLLEGMSEYYSKNLAREVLKGKHETALQCKHNGGQPPYGLMVNKDGTYAINEYEAEAVRMMFRLTGEGYTMTEIKAALADRGFATRSGRSFATTTINTMLHNEKYCGTYVYNRTKPQPKGGKRTNESRPDDEIIRIPNGIPAIIDNRTFEEVQVILKRRSNMGAKRARAAKEVYLLQGLIKCGNCGASMVGNRRKDGRNKALRITYECNGRKTKTTDCKMRGIRRDFIENIVIDYIEQYILSDEAMERVKEKIVIELNSMTANSPTSLPSLNKELRDTEQKLNKLIEAITSGINALVIKDQIEALDQKKQQLETQIEQLKARQQMISSFDDIALDNYIKQYRDIRSKTRLHQKEIINKFVDEVLVYDNDQDGDKIIIKVKFPESYVTIVSGDSIRNVSAPLHDVNPNLFILTKNASHYGFGVLFGKEV